MTQETLRSSDEELASTSLRAVRFIGVTVVTASLGQLLIFMFFAGFGWAAVVSNAVAVLIVAVVGFTLSLRFVWIASDARFRTRQITVFFLMSILGLVVSTAMVRLVASRLDHVLAANIGSFLGYGIAWLMRFVVLDRYVFRRGG